jgi:transcription elongation factor Elf1
MAATSYDGTCKNCGSDLSIWMEVRKNIDGIPVPEVWCIDCIRGNSSSSSNTNNNLQKD